MSPLNKNRCFIAGCCLIAVTLLFCCALWGQGQATDAREHHLKFAYDFLRKAYPAMNGDEVVDFHVRQHIAAPWPDNYEVSFEITRFDPSEYRTL